MGRCHARQWILAGGEVDFLADTLKRQSLKYWVMRGGTIHKIQLGQTAICQVWQTDNRLAPHTCTPRIAGGQAVGGVAAFAFLPLLVQISV